jgi:hypothetical protein
MSGQLPLEIEQALANLRQALNAYFDDHSNHPPSEPVGVGESEGVFSTGTAAASTTDTPYPGTVGEVPAPAQDIILPQLPDQSQIEAPGGNDHDLPYPQMPSVVPESAPPSNPVSAETNPFLVTDSPLTAAPTHPEVLNVPETSPPAMAVADYQAFTPTNPGEAVPSPSESENQSFTKARSLLSNVLQKQGGEAT